jgi:hypothetical protein
LPVFFGEACVGFVIAGLVRRFRLVGGVTVVFWATTVRRFFGLDAAFFLLAARRGVPCAVPNSTSTVTERSERRRKGMVVSLVFVVRFE